MSTTLRRSARAAFLAAAALGAALAGAQGVPERVTGQKVLRICKDPNNLPFSDAKGEGIEDKVAEVLAQHLGLKLESYAFPQRMNFVRNTIRYKLPGDQDFRCDLIVGTPAGFEQVSATQPYYRSTYALVFPKGKGMDGVRTPQDFLALERARLEKLRIGVYDVSPATAWLVKHQLVDQGVPYKILNADPDQYPGEIIERDLASGKLDAAIVWGPIAGFYAQRVKSPELVVVPLPSEPGVRFDYPMAMGVRYGEPQWKAMVEGAIQAKRPEIDAILKSFGVPLLPLEAPAAAGSK